MAWGLALLVLVLHGVAIRLLDLIGPAEVPGFGHPAAAQIAGEAFLLLSCAGVGALIASRRPRNPIGWLFVAFALFLSLNLAADGYAVFGGVIAPGSLPGPSFVKWAVNLTSVGGFAVLALLLAVFPNGHLPSRRWRVVVYASAAAWATGALESAIQPGPMGGLPLNNPFGVEAAAPLRDVLSGAAQILIALSMFGGMAAAIVRLRRSTGVERQQLKWFGYAASIAVVGLFAAILSPEEMNDAVWSVALPSVGLIPIAAAFAIFRYRLYDIDVLIRRTLIYAAVSAVLVAAYVGVIALSQAILAPFTSGSSVAVAVSTLAVVALFQPVRARIRSGVDRRFYRSKYDAERTLDAFASRLRDDVDLYSLERELLAVVSETLQPVQASMWLREARR
ncbi:MAG: hypothetical protein NVS9B6_17310 [Candidatus Limnocylindrales bacterium]